MARTHGHRAELAGVAASPSVALRVEDLPGLTIGQRTLELVEGELFVSLPATPYLRSVIDRVAGVLRSALAGTAPHAEVCVEIPLTLGSRTSLTPDVLVRHKGRGNVDRHDASTDGRPELVVEVRTESTDRYALGPKRMVYSSARIPEYWFFDPVAAGLLVFRLDVGMPDYPWPPVRLAAADRIEPLRAPGAEIEVASLLPFDA